MLRYQWQDRLMDLIETGGFSASNVVLLGSVYTQMAEVELGYMEKEGKVRTRKGP